MKHLTKPLKLASNYMAYSHCKNPKMQQFEEHCHNHHRVEIHFQMTMSWNWDPEKLPIPPRKNGMGARNTLIRMKWKLGILLFEWDEFGSSSSDSHPNWDGSLQRWSQPIPTHFAAYSQYIIDFPRSNYQYSLFIVSYQICYVWFFKIQTNFDKFFWV